ncbi:MAG: hypothetical protein H6513_08120, partial [Acidimicrobiaceae bacterium]|nr:hypothetical protein [Acidimicrobiaceae bacterium]
ALAGTVVAAVVSVAAHDFPVRSGLLVAVAAGVSVAMATEKWRHRVQAVAA